MRSADGENGSALPALRSEAAAAARGAQGGKMIEKVENLGGMLVKSFHLLALFVIGGTVVWSAGHYYIETMQQGYAKLHDILLLFIYLEIGAMVGIYFKTHRLPVRFLIYVAITALTRLLTIDAKDLTNEQILTVTGAILVLALAALTVEFSAARFQPPEQDI